MKFFTEPFWKFKSAKKTTRFVIAGTPRSGTNWLRASLNSHPSILCEGELLDDPYMRDNPVFQADPWAGLQHLYQAPREELAVGFKAFYFHCDITYPQHSIIWKKLAADKDLRVVFITRKNLLKLILSWDTAKQTGQWKLNSPNAPRLPAAPCTLDAHSLMTRFEGIEQGIARLRSVFRRQKQVELSYEEMMANPESSLAEVQHLLRVPQMPLSCSLQKQETRPLREAIANYDEIERTLARTPRSGYLDIHP